MYRFGQGTSKMEDGGGGGVNYNRKHIELA